MSIKELNEGQVEALDEEYLNYSTDVDTTCTICQAEFIDPDDLAIHLKQIHKVIDFDEKICYFCSSDYTDLISYAVHLRDEHFAQLKYCQHCLRAFPEYDELRKHEKKHKVTKKPSLSCTQCNKKFGNSVDLKKHDFESHKNNLDGVLMQQFLPYLSAVMNVKAETIMQSLIADTVYICVCCEYSTADIETFLYHAKTSKCTPYVCSTCSNVYKRKHNLKRHIMNTCNNTSVGKWFKCTECLLIFNDPKKYLTHKKSCKVIKCYTCGIHYETLNELTAHQTREHPLSVELKSCTFCWKECVGNVALQKHIERSHKSELHLYKYLCVHCQTPFKHPQKLFGHLFTKHKDIQPYTCKICNMNFRLRKKFTLHIKLGHKSVGYVEFDENYNVFFTDKKSEKPFVPKSIYIDQVDVQTKGTALENTEDSNSIPSLNINSEMSVTETEGNQTEVETVPKPTLKRKRIHKPKKVDDETIQLQSSDDEPLLVVKKRVQKTMPKVMRNRWTKKQLTSINKKRFTCNVCKKYCYTYQNYNHHMTLHSKKDYKKCIKCSKVFRSKEQLNNHIANDHSSSKLTDTLKYMLEKRKKGENIMDKVPLSEKFRKTIKKVMCEEINYSPATISPVDNGLSVQKFIENFTPEAESKPNVIIDNAVTFKIIQGTPKKPAIKMTKFESKPIPTFTKLSMPVRFKTYNYHEKTVASIRLVQPSAIFTDDSQDNDFQNYDDDDIDHDKSIPEVAEEVMLEGTEESPKVMNIPHKIVIPKLTLEYKDIRIAHLLPKAPFYKIVKVDDVLNIQNYEGNVNKGGGNAAETIKLRDGTKLVNTNPLAHLLGKTPIDKILEPIKKKYYKPKVRDFQGMLAEALSNLDKPTPKKKKKDNPEVAESITSEMSSNL